MVRVQPGELQKPLQTGSFLPKRLAFKTRVQAPLQAADAHASVEIALDRYGHLTPQSYDQASDRLEAALFGSVAAAAARLA